MSGSSCTIAIDIDGTIVPIVVNFEELRNKIRGLLGINHPLRPLGESLHLLEVENELKKRAWELIDQAELESIHKINIEDVKESIETIRGLLSDKSVEVIFVTMRSKRSAQPLMLKLGLLPLAEMVITRDNYPLRQQQLEFIKEHSKGRKVVFIGDTIYDEKAANSLSLPFIKVNNYRDFPRALAKALEVCKS